jgi:hypothetical protein
MNELVLGKHSITTDTALWLRRYFRAATLARFADEVANLTIFRYTVTAQTLPM